MILTSKTAGKSLNFGHLHEHLQYILCSIGQLQWVHPSLALPDRLSIFCALAVHPQRK